MYPAIIISHKVITAGVLNFKMAASHFFGEVINAIVENSVSRGTKDVTQSFAKRFSKVFFLIKLNLLKILAYLNTSNHHNCNKI